MHITYSPNTLGNLAYTSSWREGKMHITYSPNTLGKKVEGLCYLHGGFALDSFTYVEPLLPSILF
jgi:hypothetical protein